MIGPVDIDVAGVAIHISALIYPSFQTVEPENAGRDQIGLSFAVGQFVEMLTDRDAPFEDHARRLACSDAIRDFVQSAWCAERAFNIGRRAARRGDDVAFDEIAIAKELQRVRADIHEQNSRCGLDAKPFAGFSDPLKRFIHV